MTASENSAYGDSFAPDYDRWWGVTMPAKEMAAALAEMARGGRALELGIGTGLIAVPLAQHGVVVSGIDASTEMVARLREKPLGREMQVVIGDMASVEISGNFSLIYVTFSTFFMLRTQEDQLRCVANAAAHLEPGGRFVVEASVNPYGTDEDKMRLVDANGEELRMLIGSYDAVSQTAHVHHLQVGPSGMRSWPMQTRFASPGELDLMARLAGMRLESRWGDWKRTTPNRNHRRLVSTYVKV